MLSSHTQPCSGLLYAASELLHTLPCSASSCPGAALDQEDVLEAQTAETLCPCLISLRCLGCNHGVTAPAKEQLMPSDVLHQATGLASQGLALGYACWWWDYLCWPPLFGRWSLRDNELLEAVWKGGGEQPSAHMVRTPPGSDSLPSHAGRTAAVPPGAALLRPHCAFLGGSTTSPCSSPPRAPPAPTRLKRHRHSSTEQPFFKSATL